MTAALDSVTIGSRWRHYNGNEYEVVMLTNEHSTNQEKYPTTVVHRGDYNGRVWSRPLPDWHWSMTRIENGETK